MIVRTLLLPKENSVVVPVLIQTFGILDYSAEEIYSVDSNIHKDSDIERLYVRRDKIGRGLRSVQTTFECYIICLRQ